jgi:hypothetical protein
MGLSGSSQAFIKKYLRYRYMENPEERFLGFFRLLEKLCYKNDSFLPHEKLQSLLDRATPFLVRYFNDAKNVRRIIKRMDRLNRSNLTPLAASNDLWMRFPRQHKSDGYMDRATSEPFVS